jgi:hypothetical protein
MHEDSKEAKPTAFRKQAAHEMTGERSLLWLGLLSLPFHHQPWTSQTAAAAKADTAKVNGSVLDDAHAAVQARLHNPAPLNSILVYCTGPVITGRLRHCERKERLRRIQRLHAIYLP